MILEIMMKVFDCLQLVHAVGYTHNDIKPANIMIDIKNTGQTYAEILQITLIDFGFASKYRDATRPDKHVI